MALLRSPLGSLLALLLTLLTFINIVHSTALTCRLTPSEKSCFFAATTKADTKIAFYFAVQSGGSFDIDYVVTGPGDRKIMEGFKERQGDFVFTARDQGEYRFCFENDGSGGFGSGGGEKMVDFEIAVSAGSVLQLSAEKRPWDSAEAFQIHSFAGEIQDPMSFDLPFVSSMHRTIFVG